MGKIFISAGHYLNDPGASSVLGTTEADEMIRTRDLIVQQLKSLGLNFVSVPDTIDLGPTIKFINARAVAGDVALEIHGNSAGSSARGAEAYFIGGNAQRELDAKRLLNALVSRVPGLRNRGAKPDNQSQHSTLGFCRQISVPSVLMELCFLTNKDDMDLLNSQRSNFAEGLVDGLKIWSGQVGTIIPLPSFLTIGIKLNNQLDREKGILVNDNSFIPIDLVDRLGIDLAQAPNIRRIKQGNIVYIKAIDLDQFNVLVGFENNTKTVTLNTVSRNFLNQVDHIMGKGNTSADQLANFLKTNNQDGLSRFPNLPQLYLDEAAIEGVNHDVAFCQMCLETGFLEFGGDVEPDQNNFCGLGTVGSGVKGASFPDAQTGVKAHIQHLKAYAATETITMLPIVDPRFNFVQRGVAPLVSDLSGRWATDQRYGEKIISLVKQLYTVAGLLSRELVRFR